MTRVIVGPNGPRSARKGMSKALFRTAQLEALALIMGEAKAAEVMAAGEGLTKELEAAGVAFKSAAGLKSGSLAAQVVAASWSAPSPFAARRLVNVARLVASMEQRGATEVEAKDIAHGLKSMAGELPAGKDRDRLVFVADALVRHTKQLGEDSAQLPLWASLRAAGQRRKS